MNFCLPKYLVDTLIEKVKSGEINPEKLSDMTSEQRHEYFKSLLGETNAGRVNAEFESKLLLKNQQQGIINWVKNITGIKPSLRNDLLSRVQKMDRLLKPEELDSFLGDLAEQRLGFGVTMEEAGKIYDLSKTIADKKELIKGTTGKSKEELDYGLSVAVFNKYVGELKREANSKNWKEIITNPGEIITKLSGNIKSLVASFDNSFHGRQGYRFLMENPVAWGENVKKSFIDMGKELKGVDATIVAEAEAFARENYRNDTYKALGLDIAKGPEEAFPESAKDKIPLLGRLFKGSDAAYNGSALRARVDIADAWVKEAKANGVDIFSEDGKAIGKVINSITGRGEASYLSPSGQKTANNLFFSIKYFHSLVDTLKAIPEYAIKSKKGVGSFARKKAAQNALKTIGSMATILTIAKILDPDSVETDPRSSKFGKIWVGKNHKIPVDITIGMGSMVVLASRLVPTIHNGKLGWWVKEKNGSYRNWGDGGYAKRTGFDFFTDFLTGKASPLAGAALEYMKAKTFEGEKPNAISTVKKLTTPLPVKTALDLAQDPEEADAFLQLLLNAISFMGGNPNPPNKNTGKKGF